MRDRREQQNLVGRHGETLLAEAAFTSVSYRRCTCAAMLASSTSAESLSLASVSGTDFIATR
ncbi:Conserved protein of unknown function (part 1) [Mycobacterium canettii CIPT 140060008]|nr:Conserved protein of unknown function (part 1) [Mycobacterium canettii CIPT 140060008]CCK56845.1 Conserved protein of unknown function (part 1) [Mycobacterium canettii CIPT 140070008]